MRNADSFLRTATGAAMLVASLLAWPVTGAAQLTLPPLPIGGGGTTQTVTGIASAVQATSLGTITTLASTGALSGLTDAREASQLMGSVPALLSADALHATAIGLSDRVASLASLGSLVLGIGTTSIGADANFGVGGGCKNGTPTWGHLEYIDHGAGLKVHGTSITAYFVDNSVSGGFDSQGRPTGSRFICGKARTNLPAPNDVDVDFVVRARDTGEPGVMDEFDIQLTKGGPLYSTVNSGFPHKLNAGNGGGGNIQLQKPNPSTTGNFGGSCPALAA